jgi:hypothetical protein
MNAAFTADIFAVIILGNAPITNYPVLIFAGTIAVAGAFLSGVMLIAAVLPLLTFKA